MQYWRNNWQLWTWSIHFIFLTDMCSFCWKKNANRDQNCSFDLIYLQRSGVYTHWLFSLMCHILSLAYTRNRPHKHTHTNKKETVCLMTSAHPTFIPHNVFFNSHHDECTSFLITQLSKNKRKFIPKVLKVHINWIQLYLYSASLRNQYKLKP